MQLLKQTENAISIFEEAHPGCCTLFIFDQSSAHASFRPDVLSAFNMNKSNGGKQRKQKDTTIPMNNPEPQYWGLPQKLTLKNGEPKGLQQTLEECGFNVVGMKAKCSPVCPIENEGCCMAHLLRKQDDFWHQTSLLEWTFTAQGHLCVFLPKFHCELNPIEMVCIFSSQVQFIYIESCSTGVGAKEDTEKFTSQNLQMQRKVPLKLSMCAQWKWSNDSSTIPGDLWMHIGVG